MHERGSNREELTPRAAVDVMMLFAASENNSKGPKNFKENKDWPQQR